jgi:hypothetical protein
MKLNSFRPTSVGGMANYPSFGQTIRSLPLAFAIFGFMGSSSAATACSGHNAPMTFHVSTSGSDASTGSVLTPFRTIQRGVDCLTVPGDRLRIADGTYTEHVTVSQKKGSQNQRRYVIEGTLNAQGEPLTILQGSRTVAADGAAVKFHVGSTTAPNMEWTPAMDPKGKAAGVWISKPAFLGSFDRGGFVDPIHRRTTRLISYGRREDLTAKNETFDLICEGTGFPTDPREGLEVPAVKDDDCDKKGCKTCKRRRPWVYMGPGVWHDSSETTPRPAHIRLTPTHNSIPGLFDYNGLSDPNKVPLAISGESDVTLKVGGSSFVTIRNLAIRFGGITVSVGNSSNNIVVDNVRIAAGQYGFHLRDGTPKNPNTLITLSNSVVDGSLPDWLFRGDLKDDYEPVDGSKNNRGRKTAETLIYASCASKDITYYNNEFINGHDLNLDGENVHFHHNLISNLHDEAVILDARRLSTGHFHHNVVERSLDAFSMSTTPFLIGPWYIYRNLIDLRRPTASYRPRNKQLGSQGVWRSGAPFKVDETGGRYYVFQNTFVVPYEPKFSDGLPPPPFNQYEKKKAYGQEIRFQNNVLAMFNTGGKKAHFMDIPPATISTIRINGNLYYRVGDAATGVFHLWKLREDGVLTYTAFNCESVVDCGADWRDTDFFHQTGVNRPPGDEAIGRLLVDPKFLSWSGAYKRRDDFRLAVQPPPPGNTSRQAGVQLEPELLIKDSSQPLTGAPDIGLYQAAPEEVAVPLRVGVKQRRFYPEFGGPAPTAPPTLPPSLPADAPTVAKCEE